MTISPEDEMNLELVAVELAGNLSQAVEHLALLIGATNTAEALRSMADTLERFERERMQ